MDSYNGTTDPDEHIENIEAVLTYRSVQGAVKCKLFVTTLRRGGVTWFKNLRRNSIDSWSDLCDEFMTHFTASRTQPKMVASLEAIVQGKSEPLRDYIERFNKEAVPHCEGSARRHRRQEGCPPRSPKDSQRIPSDRKDLHQIRRRGVCGQHQQIQEGGFCY